MTDSLRITLAQRNPIVGDLSFNLELIRKTVQEAPEETDLIVFPEMIICGYSPEDLILKSCFLEQVTDIIEQITAESRHHHRHLVISAPVKLEGKIYNAAYVIGNGKKSAPILKTHLPNYGIFDEARLFSSGRLSDPVSIKGHKIGILICEDLWYPDVAAHLKSKGAEMLIACNASPFHIRKYDMRMDAAQARVRETDLPLIYVNQCGGQDDLVFDGASFILNESGNLMLQAAHFAEDTHHTIWERAASGHWLCSTETIAPLPGHDQLIYQAAMTGLRDYVTKNGFPGVLIGMSGGIDSALSAAIAVDALGKDMVHCVMMPSRFTSQESLDDAAECAGLLGVHYETVSIKNAVQAFEEELATHFTAGTPETVHENIQPRCRGLILMALSNANGKMVLSTGNKSEMSTGYATLYGDMAGGLAVIKDVLKTQVYELVKYRNSLKPVIPERIITKEPTAELKLNQKDSDTLPIYSQLDPILKAYVEEDKDINRMVKSGIDRQIAVRVSRMVDRNEYKRRQSPPGIRITAKAFGRDRRIPITNKYSG